MRKLLLPLLSLLAFPTLAQEPSSLTDRTFQLGEVRVSGISHRASLSSRLTYRTIEQFNRNDLSNALNILPGVTMANVGPRNESVIYVRGFDLRQRTGPACPLRSLLFRDGAEIGNAGAMQNGRHR